MIPVSDVQSADGSERSDRPDNHVSPFPYPGSKGREASWLLEKMPPHDTFVDVFGGSGAVIYNKPPSKNEVYNDINDDLVQFFEVLRTREDELVEWLRRVPYSRSVYEEWVAAHFDGYRPDDAVERAGRFFTLRYMQQRGRMDCPAGFRARAKWPPSRSFDNARERLNELADRFRQVIVENRDYQEILQHYDHPGVDVLFYLDAPYEDNEFYYSVEFDHGEFADALLELQNDWMVSYGDLPGEFVAKLIGAVRSDGREFHVLDRSRQHRMCQSASEATEHLVCSFNPSERSQFLEDGEQTTLVAATDGGDENVTEDTGTERQGGSE